MIPANAPPESRERVRLLVIDPRAGAVLPARFADLPALLHAGDLLVVNDAATLPASLTGHSSAGAPIEVRLIGPHAQGWRAVLLGTGDWRTPTERRAPPAALTTGDRIHFRGGLSACVEAVSALSPRLVEVRFNRQGAELWSAIYHAGAPVQYAYLNQALALWSVQTVYAARPWAVEMPSAGRPLTWEILSALRRRGVGLAAVTHAAGLSSTGDARIDAALPLPERYEIPAATVTAVANARTAGGRVIAVGTTVVRALEGCARTRGHLLAGVGETDLIIGLAFAPRVVDALLSGVHTADESHWHILAAFAGTALLTRATSLAEDLAFRSHELGDCTLVLPGALTGLRAAA